MKAIILAAGRGLRMRDLTDERPKCLVEMRGKVLLDWQLEALRGAGVSDIAIVAGYKSELLSNRGLVEFQNPRWAETNMVSSLACAQEWLLSEPCIVSYSDIFYEALAVESLIKSTARLAITYDPHWLKLWEKRFDDPLLDAETFRLNSICSPCKTAMPMGVIAKKIKATPIAETVHRLFRSSGSTAWSLPRDFFQIALPCSTK